MMKIPVISPVTSILVLCSWTCMSPFVKDVGRLAYIPPQFVLKLKLSNELTWFLFTPSNPGFFMFWYYIHMNTNMTFITRDNQVCNTDERLCD